jgi:hypothetical protein
LRAEDRPSLIGWSATQTNNYRIFGDPKTKAVYAAAQTGEIYEIKGEVWAWRPEKAKPVDVNTDKGAKILARVVELQTRDKLIHALREKKAEEFSGGDPILRNILIQHIEDRNGRDPAPMRKKGIDLYSVGENASHTFYLGTKEGRIFRYASGDDPPNVKDSVLNSLGVEEVDPGTLTEQQVDAAAGEYAKEIAYYLSTSLFGFDEIVPKPAAGASYEEWERYTEEFGKAKERLVASWTPILRPFIRRAFDPTIVKEEKYPTVELPEYGPVRFRLENDPVDVTDKESTYLGRYGFFINPGDLKQPAGPSELDEEGN